MATAFADTTITKDEFEVDYSGGVLTVQIVLVVTCLLRTSAQTMVQLWYQN